MGTWTVCVEHIGVRVLEQKQSTVTGTLDWPQGDPIELTGAFTGETLVFFGEAAGEANLENVGAIVARDDTAR